MGLHHRIFARIAKRAYHKRGTKRISENRTSFQLGVINFNDCLDSYQHEIQKTIY